MDEEGKNINVMFLNFQIFQQICLITKHKQIPFNTLHNSIRSILFSQNQLILQVRMMDYSFVAGSVRRGPVVLTTQVQNWLLKARGSQRKLQAQIGSTTEKRLFRCQSNCRIHFTMNFNQANLAMEAVLVTIIPKSDNYRVLALMFQSQLSQMVC